jgi:hypothetical protein
VGVMREVVERPVGRELEQRTVAARLEQCIGDVVAHQRGIVFDAGVEQHAQRLFREGEARRAPAARPVAEMTLVGVEPAAEPMQLVALADLV